MFLGALLFLLNKVTKFLYGMLGHETSSDQLCNVSDLLGEKPTVEKLVEWLTDDLRTRSIIPPLIEDSRETSTK